MNNPDTLAKLATNGYEARAVEDSDQIAVFGAEADSYYYRGTGDYASDKRTLKTPTISLAVLSFTVEQHGDGSPLGAQFIAELLQVIAPKPRDLREVPVHPLVRTTATSLHAVFNATDMQAHQIELREEGPYGTENRMCPNGLRFSDAGRFGSQWNLEAAAGAVQMDGTWHDGRSPINTRRTALPTFDRDALVPELRALVDAWAARGDLQECGLYAGEDRPADYWSHEAVMARQGLRHVPSAPEPEPAPHPDPRVRRAFWRKDARGGADSGRRS